MVRKVKRRDFLEEGWRDLTAVDIRRPVSKGREFRARGRQYPASALEPGTSDRAATCHALARTKVHMQVDLAQAADPLCG
jgi:hypothetical protein